MQGTVSGWVPRESVNYRLPGTEEVIRIIHSVDNNGHGIYRYLVPQNALSLWSGIHPVK